MGKLTLEIVAAKDLAPSNTDGTATPYTLVSVAGQTNEHKTKARSNTVSPVWNEIFLVLIKEDLDPLSQILVVTVRDAEHVLLDDAPLGQSYCPLGGLVQGRTQEKWLSLVPQGQIHLRLTPLDFGEPPEDPGFLPSPRPQHQQQQPQQQPQHQTLPPQEPTQEQPQQQPPPPAQPPQQQSPQPQQQQLAPPPQQPTQEQPKQSAPSPQVASPPSQQQHEPPTPVQQPEQQPQQLQQATQPLSASIPFFNLPYFPPPQGADPLQWQQFQQYYQFMLFQHYSQQGDGAQSNPFLAPASSSQTSTVHPVHAVEQQQAVHHTTPPTPSAQPFAQHRVAQVQQPSQQVQPAKEWKQASNSHHPLPSSGEAKPQQVQQQQQPSPAAHKAPTPAAASQPAVAEDQKGKGLKNSGYHWTGDLVENPVPDKKKKKREKLGRKLKGLKGSLKKSGHLHHHHSHDQVEKAPSSIADAPPAKSSNGGGGAAASLQNSGGLSTRPVQAGAETKPDKPKRMRRRYREGWTADGFVEEGLM